MVSKQALPSATTKTRACEYSFRKKLWIPRAPKELHSSFRESTVFLISSTKSRRVSSRGAGFQERRGINVKTNDSGCKGERGEGGRRDSSAAAKRENSRGRGVVTRAVAATRTVTIPFYFPRSLVSLALKFSTFISTPCPCYPFTPAFIHRRLSPSAAA